MFTLRQLRVERHSDPHVDLPSNLLAFFPITTASPY